MKEYFSHDYSTRLDDKIKKLIRKHGMAGYGSYWAIIEDLYNNANALPLDYEGIAFDIRIEESMAKSIINDFDLFVIDGDEFGSISVGRRIEERNQKSKKARESALSRWNKDKADANAMRTQCDSNAIKEKEIKEKKINTWRDDFNIYKNELREVYLDLINDDEYISLQEKYRPNLDIKLSLEKACMLYWATEAGWKQKKSKKSKTIDWKQTLTNALDMNSNKVYKPKP